MKTDTHDVGDLIRIETTFYVTNESNQDIPTDPNTISLVVYKPNGTTQNVTPVRVVAGVYYGDVIPANGESGWWHYVWQGTGVVQSSREGEFYVRKGIQG